MATPHQIVDRVGGWLSLVCAIHCAVVPVGVLLGALGLPMFGALELFDDSRFELVFSCAAAIFVAISLGLGVRGGADRRPMVVGFAIGLALIAGSHLSPGPEWLGHLVLVAGALTVAYTHRRSLRSRSCCEQRSDDPSAPASAP